MSRSFLPRRMRDLAVTATLVLCASISVARPAVAQPWHPAPGTTWQWQLTEYVAGRPDLSVDAMAYDLDAFATDPAVVAELHARGRYAICYISAGSWEDWRPDKDTFPSATIGKDYKDWEGEKWLDIRRLDVLGPPLQARLDLCRNKGFDAVEPDNIDGYQADSGFPLTPDDQLRFNRWLAAEAHRRGLSIALKNDGEQVPELMGEFEFAIVESCFERRECDDYQPFVASGKAVFEVEYRLAPDQFCSDANARGFDAMRKQLELNAWRSPC